MAVSDGCNRAPAVVNGKVASGGGEEREGRERNELQKMEKKKLIH